MLWLDQSYEMNGRQHLGSCFCIFYKYMRLGIFRVNSKTCTFSCPCITLLQKLIFKGPHSSLYPSSIWKYFRWSRGHDFSHGFQLLQKITQLVHNGTYLVQNVIYLVHNVTCLVQNITMLLQNVTKHVKYEPVCTNYRHALKNVIQLLQNVTQSVQNVTQFVQNVTQLQICSVKP